MKRQFHALVWAMGALIVSACTSEGTCPSTPPADACGSDLQVRFDPFVDADAFRPYPSSTRMIKAPYQPSGWRLDYPKPFGEALNTIDGFGPYAPIYISFNQLLVDPNIPTTVEETTQPDSPVFLVDLTAIRENPDIAFADVVQPMHVYYNDVLAGATVNTLVALPYFPLKARRDYLFVITTGLTAATQDNAQRRCVSPSAATACLQATSTVPAKLEDTRKALVPAWRWLEKRGFPESEIAYAMPYSTQSVEDELLQVRKDIEKMKAPVGHIDPNRIWDVSDANGNLTDDFRAALEPLLGLNSDIDLDIDSYEFDTVGKAAYGSYQSIDYRHEEARFWIPNNATGRVEPQTIENLDFFLVEPKPDPEHGIGPPYKTLIFQHALGVCKETMIAMANSFTERGIAIIGIDVANLGSRTPDDEDGNPWNGQCQQDALNFLELDNPLAARDNFRQTVADQMQFVKLVKTLFVDLDGDGQNDLDTDRLAYTSQSLGSIIGGVFLALEPDVGAGVLNVGGGGLYSIALSFFGGGSEDTGPSAFADLPPIFLDFFLVVQTMLERADPIHYAKGYWRRPYTIRDSPNPPTSLLMQMAIDDGVVGNYSTESMMRSVGGVQVPKVFRSIKGVPTMASPVSGNVADGQATVAVSQFDPAGHPFLLVQDDPEAFYRGQQQMAIFVDTYLNEGVPVVVDAWNDAELAAYAP